MQRKKIAIRFLSQQGNTKKIAQAMADELGVPALDISHPVEQADILFLGCSIHWLSVDKEMKNFIHQLDKEKIKKVVVFSTSLFLERAYPQIKELLLKQGIPVENRSFNCHGMCLHLYQNCPNEDDIYDARRFVKVLSEKLD